VTVKARLASGRFDWLTPEWFLDLVRDVAPIGLDPCTSLDNPTNARRFIVQRDGGCGLRDRWVTHPDEVTFVNPPYGAHLSGNVEPDHKHKGANRASHSGVGFGRGWAKRIASYVDGATIALVPVRTDTKWWREMFGWADCACLWSSSEFGSRISCVDPIKGIERRGSNIASTVFFRAGGSVEASRFRAVFGPHGTVIDGGRKPQTLVEILGGGE